MLLSSYSSRGEVLHEYYYVPTLILKGMPEFIGQETGNTYTLVSDEMMLICLNAVDGTVINNTDFSGNSLGAFIG